MTTQHTPGPWNVTGLYVRERDGGLVASIIDLWHDQKTPKAEKNANARLIAAAPDMLDALQNILNGIETGVVTSDHDEIFNNASAKARAAIDKATK